MFVRKFQFEEVVRRFDTTMINSEERKSIVDYQGSHQQLAVDLSVSEEGGLRVRSGESRVYLGFIGSTLPGFLASKADGHGWYDEDEKRFKIKVDVKSDLLGPVFGYSGSYDTEYVEVKPGEVPEDLKPVREERRE